jgi:hypothetical protein
MKGDEVILLCPKVRAKLEIIFKKDVQFFEEDNALW